jgi:hypothetical protein
MHRSNMWKIHGRLKVRGQLLRAEEQVTISPLHDLEPAVEFRSSHYLLIAVASCVHLALPVEEQHGASRKNSPCH